MKRQFRMKFRGEEFTVNAERSGDSIIIERDGATYTVELIPAHDGAGPATPTPASPSPPTTTMPRVAPTPPASTMPHVAPTPSTPARVETAASSGGAAGAVSAPMTGTIKEVRVQPGDTIAEGQTVIVMEAMKMEMEISAHRCGTVGEILCAAGDSVKEKQPLLTVA